MELRPPPVRAAIRWQKGSKQEIMLVPSDSTYWQGKRVIVTGGAGFLGSYIVDKLRARGCEDILAPRSAKYDLVREEAVERLYGDFPADVVIHAAAAVGGIGANQAEPGRFFYENALMGVHMVEHARRSGVEKFVCIGTICAYPKFTPIPFTEDNLWMGYPEETNAPYGIAKKSLMVMLDAYRQQYGMNGIYLLPVNLYGPRDNFDPKISHVIPALIRRCQEAMDSGQDEVTVWGTGRATREFLFVEDAAEGILLAAEHYNDSQPINIGAGFEISIRNLVELIADKMGFQGRIVWDHSKPDGQPRRMVDSSLAFRSFGYKAATPFEEGIEATIAWYRASLAAMADAP